MCVLAQQAVLEVACAFETTVTQWRHHSRWKPSIRNELTISNQAPEVPSTAICRGLAAACQYYNVIFLETLSILHPEFVMHPEMHPMVMVRYC